MTDTWKACYYNIEIILSFSSTNLHQLDWECESSEEPGHVPLEYDLEHEKKGDERNRQAESHMVRRADLLEEGVIKLGGNLLDCHFCFKTPIRCTHYLRQLEYPCVVRQVQAKDVLDL